MAKYTGRRIVPKHAGEWDIRKEYEELQIVLDADSGNSFISNLPVPKGTALSDEKYWSLFSLHSEQIAEAEEHLTQTAEDIRSELSETENRINKNVSDTEGRINESLSSTESKVNTSLSETENRVTARVENAKSDLTAKVAAAEQQMNQNAQNVAQTNKALNARMGKILIGTGKVDTTLSYSGMAADAAIVGQAFKEEREYTDTLASGKLDAVRSRNLLDPSRYRPGWFAFVHSSIIQYHADNLRYGSTDYIPVSEKGLVTKGSGTNGVTSQVVFDKAKKALRYVDANDQYTYQEGDAYVMFFYMASSGQKLCVVEGTEYVYEAYTDYKPLDDLKQELNSLQTEADNQKKQLTNLTTRLDQLVAVPEKKDLRLVPAAPVYTVCNNLSTARNYHVSVWVDHLIAETGWKDRAAGFGTEMEERFDLYSPFTNTAVNSGEDVLEQTVEKSFVSDVYKTQKLKFKHRSTLASMGKNQFPKILVIGDSVTDGYLAGVGKTDADLPTHYWSWVRYLFDLDRKDAKAAETEYRCLMVGMPGTVNGKHYGSSSSFKLDGKTVVNYAMGKGGWSAEDLNLATFESASNINPFYDEKTKGFSLKACLDKYRTLADNGMTRLIPGETAGTEVKDANAYDLCTPTHVVINLNHNSSLAEYKANIPDIVKAIKREYPDIIVILMSIDETGTYFPAKYPEYRASEITLGGLHSKNVSIYQYFCDELQDEANGVYVCSGHLIQPAVESYPTLDYVSADSVGRQSGRVLHMAYGRGQYGGPNWHPNNYAHCAWGYQLYALVKYTLALQDMK